MNWMNKVFKRRAATFSVLPEVREPKLLIPQACFSALIDCLAPAQAVGHEGIAFLLGRTDGITALCAQAVRPRALTTPGSFHVGARDMARIIEAANDLSLQVIGQVHTHPRAAGHSDGDEDGANIRFDGFVSMVIPDYGVHLPNLDGSALYIFSGADRAWQPMPLSSVHILPSGVAWR